MNSTSVFGIRAWIVAGAGNATVFSANFGTFKLCSAKLVLFNPLVIKITVEGGKSMDYRIVQTKEQKFIAVVRSFQNEIINDEENHDIPDFWGECNEKNLLGPICNLRPEGKRDLYGLCTPTKEGKDTFEYGIGVLVDEQTADFDMAEMEKAGFCVWDVKPGTYVVFARPPEAFP